jgi:hypothetical protein
MVLVVAILMAVGGGGDHGSCGCMHVHLFDADEVPSLQLTELEQ